MALVNTEFERNEVDRDRSLGVLADLDVLVLAVEGGGSFVTVLATSLGSEGRLSIFSCFATVGYFTASLLCSGSGSNSSLDLLSSKFLSASSSLVEDLDIEEDVLREAILNDKVDLLRFVKLGRLGKNLN